MVTIFLQNNKSIHLMKITLKVIRNNYNQTFLSRNNPLVTEYHKIVVPITESPKGKAT